MRLSSAEKKNEKFTISAMFKNINVK